MKFNIIIQYRPLSRGGLNSPTVAQYQNEKGEWNDMDGEYKKDGDVNKLPGEDILLRTINFLKKNSVNKHNYIIATDYDVYFNEQYLRSLEDVKVVKADKLITAENAPLGFSMNLCRVNTALLAAIHSIPDEEWICSEYLSDLICSKGWDKPIIDAIERYGENCVYVPMFTEVKECVDGPPGHLSIRGVDPTPTLIWNTWRQYVNHALSMPLPKDREYFTEADVDYFVQKANDGKMGIIVEPPGNRIYGYYAVMFMKAKHAKRAMRMMGTYKDETPFDLDFDNRLHSVCGLRKVVVTNSFVVHPWFPFR